MTREIKFKYWDTDKMKMLHTAKEANASITEYDDDRKIKWLQYTGLKDVNGKEVYEGDIVNWSRKTWKVVWHKRIAGFVMENTNLDLERIDIEFESEVIGNIYETPELLVE